MSGSNPYHCYVDGSDPRLEATLAAVDWNVVASIACRVLEVSHSRWGSQLSGGYNVVRFLHMDDKNHAVRPRPVPTCKGLDCREFAGQLSSEVATMQYVRAHTSIPVPRIIHHSIEVDSGGVGSPLLP